MRKRLPSVAVLVVIGFVGLFSLMTRPRFQAFHTVDVLQLIVSGMCFGVALSRAITPRSRD